jgi:hypothetical protein
MDHFHKIIYFIFYFFIYYGFIVLGNSFPGKINTYSLDTCTWIVIAGFRSHVGADYDSYVVWYIDKTCDCDFELGF